MSEPRTKAGADRRRRERDLMASNHAIGRHRGGRPVQGCPLCEVAAPAATEPDIVAVVREAMAEWDSSRGPQDEWIAACITRALAVPAATEPDLRAAVGRAMRDAAAIVVNGQETSRQYAHGYRYLQSALAAALATPPAEADR